MRDMEADMRLGRDLLDSINAITEDPEQLDEYNHILELPGIDGALYLLYDNKGGYKGHPRPLLQSAFMLGFYMRKSLDNAERIWDNGLPDEPLSGLV